jgi:hypothetical protein
MQNDVHEHDALPQFKKRRRITKKELMIEQKKRELQDKPAGINEDLIKHYRA